MGALMLRVDLEAVREWLVASCAAQGVPVHVTDPAVVSQLGALLGPSGDRGVLPRRGGAATPEPSAGPGGNDAGRVQGPGA
jgi:hypothetical protein